LTVLNEGILFFSNLKKLIIAGYLKRFSNLHISIFNNFQQ